MKAQRVRSLGEPSVVECEQHELPRLPYSNWRRACIMGRARQEGQRRQPRADNHELPDISVDYVFLDIMDGLGVTMLVARRRRTRMSYATVVLGTETTGAVAARWLVTFLRQLGAGQAGMIIKTDGEATVKAMVDDVAGLRPMAKTIREEAPRRSSASDGVSERAVQSVVHQLEARKIRVRRNVEEQNTRRTSGDPLACRIRRGPSESMQGLEGWGHSLQEFAGQRGRRGRRSCSASSRCRTS